MFSADRLQLLPPYLFVEIDRKKRLAIEAGLDVIDFGIGDPDQPTPDFVIEQLCEAVRDPENHHYGSSLGTAAFRDTVTEYLQKRYKISLDPTSEIMALIGTKEGIAHLPTAIINPGEVVLVPDPGYPVYTSGTIFAGGEVCSMPLSESNDWLPVLAVIPQEIRRRAKIMFINYPNNPTAACASMSFFEKLVEFAHEYNILIAQDAAYSEVYFEDPPPSILQIKGAKEVCIEFHSLSKTFNMTGWRVGFVAGNADALASLAKVKNNIDSGTFPAVECAAIEALRNVNHSAVRGQMEIYRRRRDALVSGLHTAGWEVTSPGATFYVWAKCPAVYDSMTVASRLLDEVNVVTIPGVGFGAAGEGYVRFALTVDEERTREAAERISTLTWG